RQGVCRAEGSVHGVPLRRGGEHLLGAPELIHVEVERRPLDRGSSRISWHKQSITVMWDCMYRERQVCAQTVTRPNRPGAMTLSAPGATHCRTRPQWEPECDEVVMFTESTSSNR